jgi:predicted DNA-binding protein
MSEKLIAFRLSEHLIQAIEARSKTTGRDKVDLVTEILARAFDTPQLNLELNDAD